MIIPLQIDGVDIGDTSSGAYLKSLSGVARVDKLLGVDMPALYIYGRRKPFIFHSARWTEQLTQAPGCEVLALDTGHWVMRQQPLECNTCVRAWMDQST